MAELIANNIAHIGIAVRSIEQALPFYTESLGLTLEKIIKVEREGVRIAFINIGDTRFELLEPLHDQSPIHQFIETKGQGIHHIALDVNDIDKRLKHLKNTGIRLIDKMKKNGAEKSEIAFIHPSSAEGVLFELHQDSK